MDDKDQKIAELEALVTVLRTQLHNALDAACAGHAKAIVLEARLAAARPGPPAP